MRRSDLRKPAQLKGVGLPRRLTAGVIDGVLAIGLMAGLGLAGNALSSLAVALRLLAVVVPLLYFVIAEGYYQTTPGKRLFGLTVVTIDGDRPDLLAHVVRGMTRVPEAMVLVPYLFVVPFSQRKQRFGDMITETLVVRRADLGHR
jgi:uncharacterized RDD family membrane protein YckC